MKKVFIVIIIILGISALSLGAYFAWKRTKLILNPPVIDQQLIVNDQQPMADDQRLMTDGQRLTTDDQRLPISTERKLKVISDQPVFDYWVFATSTKQIFYLNQGGLILKVKENAEDEVITPEPISNIQLVKSSPDGRLVLMKSEKLRSLSFAIFNNELKTFELLTGNITAAAFSPDSKKIAYLENKRDKSDLVIKDLINPKQKPIQIISVIQKDFDLEWILPEKIILTPKPSALYQDLTWIIDLNKKTINPLGAETFGSMIKWSSNGKRGLRFSSQLGGRERYLNLINDQGAVLANLEFITLPNKCLISDPQIYCAIPTDIPSKAILPDDYLKKAIYFKDGLYQIDINQNSFSEIFTEAEPVIDAINLKIVNNKLLFVNRYDNKLYELEL